MIAVNKDWDKMPSDRRFDTDWLCDKHLEKQYHCFTEDRLIVPEKSKKYFEAIT